MIRNGSIAAQYWSALREQAAFWITFITLAATAIGLSTSLHGLATGDWSAVSFFFRYPNTVLTLLFSALGAVLSLYARTHFDERDALRRAWTWLSAAAVTHLIGRILAVPKSGSVHDAGVILAGPAQMLLLLIGLIQVAAHCRRLGIFRGLTRFDYVLIAIVGGLTVRTLFGIFSYIHAGKPITWVTALEWPSDPLLMLLLINGVFIHRSTSNMGHGLIANCWRSFVAGVLLTALGDASLWCLDCTGWSVWMMIGWYVWLVADAAFALAPALQVAALTRSQVRSELLSVVAAPARPASRATPSMRALG